MSNNRNNNPEGESQTSPVNSTSSNGQNGDQTQNGNQNGSQNTSQPARYQRDQVNRGDRGDRNDQRGGYRDRNDNQRNRNDYRNDNYRNRNDNFRGSNNNNSNDNGNDNRLKEQSSDQVEKSNDRSNDRVERNERSNDRVERNDYRGDRNNYRGNGNSGGGRYRDNRDYNNRGGDSRDNRDYNGRGGRGDSRDYNGRNNRGDSRDYRGGDSRSNNRDNRSDNRDNRDNRSDNRSDSRDQAQAWSDDNGSTQVAASSSTVPSTEQASENENLANQVASDNNAGNESNSEKTDQTENTNQKSKEPPVFDDTIHVHESFDDMNLSDEILQGIYSLGFEKPSAIQKKAIVPLLKGRDIIAQSQSGTGKTGAFTIGSLGRVNPKLYELQVIIISPTRELADQTCKVMQSLTKVLKDVKMKLAIGGTRVPEDIEEIRRVRPQILIGTPGRIMDLISRNAFRTQNVHTFILDEADEMLSRGFKLQIQDIFRRLPETITTGLFSATLSPETLEVTENFMNHPIKILIQKEGLTLEGIKQFYVDAVYEDAKLDCIIDIYKALNLTQTIVYTNTQKWCDRVTESLEKEGFPVRSIHAGMNQELRHRTLQEFRDGSARMLVTTNVLARGIDIQQIKLVINYDLPTEEDFENYIHRIGRSGRYGRQGVAINLVVQNDIYLLKKLEQYFHTTIEELPDNFATLI